MSRNTSTNKSQRKRKKPLPKKLKKHLRPDGSLRKNPKCEKCDVETAVFFVGFPTEKSGAYDYSFTCEGCAELASKPYINIRKLLSSPGNFCGTLVHLEDADIDRAAFMGMAMRFARKTNSYHKSAYD